MVFVSVRVFFFLQINQLFNKPKGWRPWKLEPAKECVKTHLPNKPALKMDDIRASDPYLANSAMGPSLVLEARLRRVGGLSG